MMLRASPRLARRILLAIDVLALAGTLVSLVSLFHHYSKSATSYCDIGENFNCDIVNRSAYSTVAGVPVALIGVAGYLAVLTVATYYRNHAEAPTLLMIGSLAGLGFASYLTYVEGFVLATWCILCLSSLSLILSIAALSSLLWAYRVRQSD